MRRTNRGPKKPRSAYVFFVQECRPEIRKENPNMDFGKLTRLIAARWKTLIPEQKRIYEQQAAEDRVRYDRECAELTKNEPARRERRNPQFVFTRDVVITGDLVVRGHVSSLKPKEEKPKIPEQMDAPDSLECVVCMEAAKNAILKPCRHACCCLKCANTLEPKLCPVCRGPIEKIKGFFIA